jgi:hypothetical protein
MTFVGIVISALVLLIFLPYRGSAAGGAREPLFPERVSGDVLSDATAHVTLPGLLAWLGGALFTAKMLVNPFYAAKFTWERPSGAGRGACRSSSPFPTTFRSGSTQA